MGKLPGRQHVAPPLCVGHSHLWYMQIHGFPSNGGRRSPMRSALARIGGLLAAGVVGSGAIVSCASEGSVGPTLAEVRLARDATVVGQVSVFDTLVNGEERTALSETSAPFEARVTARRLSASLPGTTYRIQIAVLARTTPTVSKTITSVSESESRVERVDSSVLSQSQVASTPRMLGSAAASSRSSSRL